MRKEILVAFSLFSLLFFASSAQAYVSLTFSSTAIPTTISPGTKANLLLTIINTGTDFAASPQLTVKSSPYVTADIPVFNLPTLNVGGSTQITIPITVAPNAPEGTVALPFTIAYTVGNNVGTVSADNSASITITKRTLLQITNVSYSNIVQRGNTFTMTITLQNVGSGQVKDLVVSLRNFSLPIVPASTDTEKFVGTLNSGQTTAVSFDLTANNNADTVTYSVPVSLSYYDDQGNIHTDTKFVGLRITGIPEFVVALDSTDNIFAGQINKMSVTISNVGTGSAEFLTVDIDSGQDVSPQTSYLGTLNPDDSSTISMNVNLAGKSADMKFLNITLTYKDTYNQEYVENKLVHFNAMNAPVQISTNYAIIIIVILAAIVYWKRNFFKSLLKRK